MRAAGRGAADGAGGKGAHALIENPVVGFLFVVVFGMSTWHTLFPLTQYALLHTNVVFLPAAPSLETMAPHCVTHVLSSVSAHLNLHQPAKTKPTPVLR